MNRYERALERGEPMTPFAHDATQVDNAAQDAASITADVERTVLGLARAHQHHIDRVGETAADEGVSPPSNFTLARREASCCHDPASSQ